MHRPGRGVSRGLKPSLCRPLLDGTETPEPQSASRQLALPGARRLMGTWCQPFAGMATGFASLNVSLLRASRRGTSLFALVFLVVFALAFGRLFRPAIGMVSSG